jgi:hypothetical protein
MYNCCDYYHQHYYDHYFYPLRYGYAEEGGPNLGQGHEVQQRGTAVHAGHGSAGCEAELGINDEQSDN